jgi:hypothetical protein
MMNLKLVRNLFHSLCGLEVRQSILSERCWILVSGCWMFPDPTPEAFLNIQHQISRIQDHVIPPIIFLTTI